MTDEEINEAYKAEFRENPHPLGSPEWEKYRTECMNRLVARFSENVTARKKVAVDEEGNVVERAANECRECGAVIPPTGKRGRPATRCGPCRGIPQESLDINDEQE